jgi:hypothetical protein
LLIATDALAKGNVSAMEEHFLLENNDSESEDGMQCGESQIVATNMVKLAPMTPLATQS